MLNTTIYVYIISNINIYFIYIHFTETYISLFATLCTMADTLEYKSSILALFTGKVKHYVAKIVNMQHNNYVKTKNIFWIP